MGLSKQYRKGLRYRVSSVRCKTIQALLSTKFRQELGMSQTESRLMGDRIGKWILSRKDIRAPNQIIFEASKGSTSFARRYSSSKKIKLTAYDVEDLDIELEFGLYVSQTARLLRMVEEAYHQDSLLSAKQITLLMTISPASLRKKIKNLRDEGIFVPIKGTSKKDRDIRNLFRSTWALKKYFQKVPLADIRETGGISKERFKNIYHSFAEVARNNRAAQNQEERQWTTLARTMPKNIIDELHIQIRPLRGAPDWSKFGTALAEDFNLSPIKLLAIKETVEEILSTMSGSRADGDIIYWAISADEPAGKPLSQARLLPTILTLYDPYDMPSPEINRDLNRVSDIKFKKAVRLATQAKVAGTYLTYA